MHSAGHLDLSPKAVASSSYLKGRMPAKDLARFKSMTRFCSTPVHIPEKAEREPVAHIAPMQGYPPPRARFGPRFNAEAEMFRLANPAFEDIEVLAAASAGFIGPDLSLLVRSLGAAEAQVIASSPFAEAAREGVFPLSVYTLISGVTAGGNRALVGSRVRQMPASAIRYPEADVWSALALSGVSGPSSMRLAYAGLAVDAGVADSCRMTVISLARGPMELAGSGPDIEPLDIAFEKEAVAAVVHSSKGIISKDMQVALSVIGYREWGPGFLRLADK